MRGVLLQLGGAIGAKARRVNGTPELQQILCLDKAGRLAYPAACSSMQLVMCRIIDGAEFAQKVVRICRCAIAQNNEFKRLARFTPLFQC